MENCLLKKSMIGGRVVYEILRIPEIRDHSLDWTIHFLQLAEALSIERHRWLEDRKPFPQWVWNKLPQDQQVAIIKLALNKPELSPWELAVTYVDEHSSFVSESAVYRLLKAHDLITNPAYILMQARDKFQHPTTRINEMWQTDFTYFKITDWGWYYLSTVLDGFSRFIIAWRLCATMSAHDASDMLDDALRFTELNQVKVKHKSRLLSEMVRVYFKWTRTLPWELEYGSYTC